MLYYKLSTDGTDEYCRTSESTANECLQRFCLAIWEVFEKYHMRQPTHGDFDKHIAINEAQEFLKMLASLDCMH